MHTPAFKAWLQQPVNNLDQWMLEGLNIGIDTLKMESAIISRINHRDYIIQQSASRLGKLYSVGEHFDLSNTYCEAVVRQHKTISFNQVGNIPEMRLHPVYQSAHLESYIGAPVHNNKGAVIGTLSFSDHEIRADGFTEEEISFIEQMAARLGKEIDP